MASYRTICNRCRRWASIGRDARSWYADARSTLARIADYRGWCYGTWADVVAICSPRCSVVRNLRVAYRVFPSLWYHDGPTIDVPNDVIRSTRVALQHYRSTGEIRGAKTRPFADVLRGSDNVVVVDTWMARAFGVEDNKARNKATQTLAYRVIGHVARAERVCLADAQAMVWSGVIQSHYKDGSVPGYRTEDIGLWTIDGALSDTPF